MINNLMSYVKKQIIIPDDYMYYIELFLLIESYYLFQIIGNNGVPFWLLGIATFIGLYQCFVKKEYYTQYQIVIVFGVVCFFLCSFYMQKKDIQQKLSLFIYYYLIVCCVSFLLIAFRSAIERKVLTLLKYVVIFLLVFSVIFYLSQDCLNSWPRWDSYAYYYDMENKNIIDLFLNTNDGLNICGHISGIYALYNILLRVIPFFNHYETMIIGNMLLVTINIMLVAQLLKKTKICIKEFQSFTISFILFLGPYFLGTVSILCLENLFTTSILLYIYGNKIDNNTIKMFAIFALINIKEFGIVFAFVFTLNDLISSFKKTRINILYYFIVLCIAIFWLILYRNSDWVSVVGSNNPYIYPTTDGIKYFSVGISVDYIKEVLKSIFLTNFTWLYLLMGVLSCVIFVIRNNIKKFFDMVRSILYEYKTVLLAFIVALCFNLVFIAYVFYRYYKPVVTFIYIISIIFIFRMGHSKRMKICILMIITILSFVQNYMSIDPIMNLAQSQIETGNSHINYAKTPMLNYKEPSFSDAAYYNKQIIFFDKCLDQAFEIVKNNDDLLKNSVILFSDEFKLKANLPSEYSIMGEDYQKRTIDRWIAWNGEKEKRELSLIEDSHFDIQMINITTNVQSFLNTHNYVYYFKMPWNDLVIDYVDQDITFQKLEIVEYGGWCIEVYRIFPKEDK